MSNYSNTLLMSGVIGILLMIPSSADAARNRNTHKPNVLIIMADDLGYGDLSVTGGKDVQTPNIDELFLRGLIFTEFYTNSTVGSPTQASLLSGRYPGLVGVPGVIRDDNDNSWGYFQSDTTLSAHFQKAGYTTALIGKWNLGFESPNLPNEKGFDLFMGFLGDQIDDAYSHLNNGKNYMRFNENEIETPEHLTNSFSNWSSDFITREADSEKPFLLLLSYNSPSPLLQPDENWLNKVKEHHPELSLNRAKNVASIEMMDDGIGKIIETLEATNQLKNTIIIFSSENTGLLSSGSSNGAMRGGKHDLYEGGIRVPTSIFWKDEIKKGSFCHQIAMTMDLFPTLCELTESPTNLELDGENLTQCIFKDIPLQKERTLFWVCREGGQYKGQAYYAVRQGAYKLMQNSPDESFQLYNLTTDSFEQIPLRKSSEHYQRLQDTLSLHILENEKVSWRKINTEKKLIQSMNAE